MILEDLDVLIVCLTNDIAAEVVISGLKKGMHVFCEKPPGQSVEDIVKVIAAEKQSPKQKLMYGFNHRYHDSVKDAFELIKSGELGKIINMRGVYGKSRMVAFNQTDWRTSRAIAGGGILLDQGIHMVDLMRFFGGEFDEVKSFITNEFWGYDVEDNAYALMRSESKIVAMLHSSATQWRHRFNLDITLNSGAIILSGFLSGTKSYGAETLKVVKASHNDNGDPREVTTRYTNDPSWESEINLFTQYIINNEKVSSGSSNDALNTMKLVYKIYYSDPLWRDKFNITDPDTL
jgi:predicted dehydrogenase